MAGKHPRGGRPKLTPEALRSEQINLRFTPPEWDEIETAAKRRAMSAADLIRSAIFAHLRDSPLPLPTRVLVNVELQRELIRIGSNLNQIAKARNAGAPLPADFDVVVAELGRQLEEL